VGSTRYVDFDTTRPTYKTKADRCHVSHVVADTDSWEQKMAQVLEDMGEVAAYVKNQNLGFTIPYVLNGEEKNYFPDFIAVRDGPIRLLNLIGKSPGRRRRTRPRRWRRRGTCGPPSTTTADTAAGRSRRSPTLGRREADPPSSPTDARRPSDAPKKNDAATPIDSLKHKKEKRMNILTKELRGSSRRTRRA
jgi:hypothetical protein